MTPDLSRRRLLVAAGATAIARPTRAGAATPEIEITPPSALPDVPLKIALRGLTPSSRVTVAAEMTARDGAVWRSHAMFQADSAGNVAVAGSAPVQGTYAIPSAMGLVWSMAREETAAASPPTRLRDPVRITFKASTDGATARATVERLVAGPGIIFRPLDAGGRLRGGWWLPARVPTGDLGGTRLPRGDAR